MRTERFRNLQEVQAHKQTLKAELDVKRTQLNVHLILAREPEFRKALMGNVVNDLIGSWQPLSMAKGLLGSSSGMVSGAVDLMLGTKRYTPMGRLIATLATAAIPAIMKRIDHKEPGDPGGLRKELGVSWQRIKEYVHLRREARRDDKPVSDADREF